MAKNWRRQVIPAALTLSSFLVGIIPSTAQESPPSTFRETATVTVIEVPVVVLRGGAPVRGLSATDFVLEQDGVEQAIEGFEQIDLSVGVMEERQPSNPPTSLAGRRYFLLAFDLSHTNPANAQRAVEAARELVEGGLHTTDLVGVSIYGAVAGARLLHPFTSNKLLLESALLAVEAVTSRDPKVVDRARVTLAATEGGSAAELLRFLKEIRAFATQQGVGLESTTGPAGDWLSEFDDSGRGAIMAETLADMEAYHQENTKYITRDRSLDFLETLADMATVLEEVRGQKYFVLFSEGIDQSFFEDYTNTLGNRQFAETLKLFRRSGWVMQSVNMIRQSFDETSGTTLERGMFALVSETGGREYRHFNRLDEAMGQMLEQTSVSYVLSFQPEGLAQDGSYHEIEVRLREPDGAKIRHRDGFFAPPDPELGEEKDFLVAVADRVASEKDGGPLGVSAIAIPFRLIAGTTQVQAVVEIDGPDLLVDQQGGPVPIEIETYLLDEEVGAVSLSVRRLILDLASQGELIRGGGVKVVEDHLLGPGEHLLRIAIVSPGSDARSLVTVPVNVPEYPSAEPVVVEPLFPELSRSWLVVRETESSPFQFGGRPFIPRADVRLEPGQVVPVVVMAFDLPESPPLLQLELVAEDGTHPTTGSLEWVSEPERTEDGLQRVMAEFDTEGLAPGRYEIRISSDSGSDGAATSSSRFIEIR